MQRSKTSEQMTSCDEAYFQLNSCGCGRRDGDTIDVRVADVSYRVRYIGVNIAERGEVCYQEGQQRTLPSSKGKLSAWSNGQGAEVGVSVGIAVLRSTGNSSSSVVEAAVGISVGSKNAARSSFVSGCTGRVDASDSNTL
jgi:hypothetical protein